MRDWQCYTIDVVIDGHKSTHGGAAGGGWEVITF